MIIILTNLELLLSLKTDWICNVYVLVSVLIFSMQTGVIVKKSDLNAYLFEYNIFWQNWVN